MGTGAYVCLLVCVVIQRLIEVWISRRNEAALLQEGASEHAPEQMPWMIALHAGWLLSSLLEVFLFDRPFRVWLAVLALLVFSAGQVLRLLAMQALDDRWTVKIITLPGAPAISDGVFQYVRHPNYLGVVLEIAALPLVHGAWLTSILFSLANGLLLRARIRAEERALRETGDYEERFASRPRFVPRMENGEKEVHEHA
ncbi:MAG: isoprenylcysteine carboxylmethyltransferase family protein [Polyangiales bacterium]